MSEPVRYALDEQIAVVTMDDGKRNALSNEMWDALNGALDRAEADSAVVLLTGREETFSAGFHLPTLKGGGQEAIRMLTAGFDTVDRLLRFPTPVVVASSGHALAMGALLLLAADLRIGAAGPYKIGTTEVAIGMTMPWCGVELTRYRLDPVFYNRAVNNAEVFTPEAAVTAGWYDRVVPAADLSKTATEAARELAALDMTAHRYTKLRTRNQLLEALQGAMERDDVDRRKRFGLD